MFPLSLGRESLTCPLAIRLYVSKGNLGYGMVICCLGLTFTLLLSALVFYAGIYIAAYEASYDAEGITAPDWFFRQRKYPWSSFEGVQTGKSFLVKMRFDGHGKLMLQKYLVGMPSLLAFLSNVETAHQQA